MTLILFILIEIDMLIGDNDNKDFVDIIFPSLTIAERGEMMKIIIIPVMLIIKNFFDYFFVNIEDKVIKNLYEITYMQKVLT